MACSQPDIASLQVKHSKQLLHYRNLLIRAQSASSVSLHELHTKLHILEAQYATLKAQHDLCNKPSASQEYGGMIGQATKAIADKKSLEDVVRCLEKGDRIRLLKEVVDGGY